MFLVQCHNSLLVSVYARKIFTQETGEILKHYTENDRSACAIARGQKIEINGKEAKSQQSSLPEHLCYVQEEVNDVEEG